LEGQGGGGYIGIDQPGHAQQGSAEIANHDHEGIDEALAVYLSRIGRPAVPRVRRRRSRARYCCPARDATQSSDEWPWGVLFDIVESFLAILYGCYRTDIADEFAASVLKLGFAAFATVV